MSRIAFMFKVLKTMYEEETLDVSYLFSSSNPYKAGGPASLVYKFIPSLYTSSETHVLISNFSVSGLGTRFSNGLVNLSVMLVPTLFSTL